MAMEVFVDDLMEVVLKKPKNICYLTEVNLLRNIVLGAKKINSLYLTSDIWRASNIVVLRNSPLSLY